MPNKDKIRMMADLAMYQKRHEDNVFRISGYFKSDYIVWQMILAFARFSLCFFLLILIYIFFHTEELFYNINLIGVGDTFKRFFYVYLAGLFAYELIAFLVSAYRYRRARKGMLLYASKLKRLARRYHYLDESERGD